jgi:hypothetical protein
VAHLYGEAAVRDALAVATAYLNFNARAIERILHALLEAVEERGGLRKAGEKACLLRGAGECGVVAAGRRGRRRQPRRLIGDGMRGDEPAGGVKDLHAHGINVNGDRRALGLLGRRVVRGVDRHQAVFLHRAGLAPRGWIRDRGERDEAGPFLGVRLVDAATGRAVHADVRDGVEPRADLGPQVVPGRERAGAQEVFLEVLERALDLD